MLGFFTTKGLKDHVSMARQLDQTFPQPGPLSVELGFRIYSKSPKPRYLPPEFQQVMAFPSAEEQVLKTKKCPCLRTDWTCAGQPWPMPGPQKIFSPIWTNGSTVLPRSARICKFWIRPHPTWSLPGALTRAVSGDLPGLSRPGRADRGAEWLGEEK